MSLIVIPQLLGQLLREVDDDLGRRMVLEYARHAVSESGAAAVPASYRAALDSAQAFLDSAASIQEFNEARVAFLHDLPTESGSRPDPVGDVVHLALNLSCGGALEDAGLVVRTGKSDVHHGFLVLAKEARAVVAGDGDPAERDRRKWEEARWQLITLISHLPNPNSPTPNSRTQGSFDSESVSKEP